MNLCLVFLFGWLVIGNFKYFGSIRFRYEFSDNFNQKYYGVSDDGFLLQRVRFGFYYDLGNHFGFSFGIQDSEVYDIALTDKNFKPFFLEGLVHSPNKDRFELYNTYIILKNIFNKDFFIKLGRQIIAYGDKRCFGPGEWGNTGRWVWDAIKIHYGFRKNFVEAFLGATLGS